MRKNSNDYTSFVKGSNASEIDGYMDDALEEAQDAIQALKANATVKILEELFFKEHHKALIPLIMILQKKKEALDEKKVESESKEKKVNYKSIFNSKPGNQVVPITVDGQKAKEEEMDLNKALELVYTSDSKDFIENRIHEYIKALISQTNTEGEEKTNYYHKIDILNNQLKTSSLHDVSEGIDINSRDQIGRGFELTEKPNFAKP